MGWWRKTTALLSGGCFIVAVYVLGYSDLNAKTRAIWGTILILLGLFWMVIW